MGRFVRPVPVTPSDNLERAVHDVLSRGDLTEQELAITNRIYPGFLDKTLGEAWDQSGKVPTSAEAFAEDMLKPYPEITRTAERQFLGRLMIAERLIAHDPDLYANAIKNAAQQTEAMYERWTR